jgi:hypothetical protein
MLVSWFNFLSVDDLDYRILHFLLPISRLSTPNYRFCSLEANFILGYAAMMMNA